MIRFFSMLEVALKKACILIILSFLLSSCSSNYGYLEPKISYKKMMTIKNKAKLEVQMKSYELDSDSLRFNLDIINNYDSEHYKNDFLYTCNSYFVINRDTKTKTSKLIDYDKNNYFFLSEVTEMKHSIGISDKDYRFKIVLDVFSTFKVLTSGISDSYSKSFPYNYNPLGIVESDWYYVDIENKKVIKRP